MMTKEQIFEEFKIAKEKDIAKSTTKPPYENVFKNRLNLLKSHRDAKKSNPKAYRHLDINFDNLIVMYQSGDPEMYMYKKHGIEPYWMKQQREEEEEKEKKKLGIKDVKKDIVIESIDTIN